MSRAAVKWAGGVKGLSRSQWAVLDAIARLVGDDGTCAKTQAFIAGKVRLKERRVREILGELEALEVITRERRTNKNGRQAANLIRINFSYGQPAISAAWPTGNPTGFGQPAIFATPIYNITPDFWASVLPSIPTKELDEIEGVNDNVITFPLAGGMRR